MKTMVSIALSLAVGVVATFGIEANLTAAGSDAAASATPNQTAINGVADQGTPRIQFETNFVDFGKTMSSEPLAGVFKFKNVGNGVLKVEPPQASCDCTESMVRPGTLAPGESGEIIYTIKLDRPLDGQRSISVRSNDPKTPLVKLVMQINHTPLYELNPGKLVVIVPAGKQQAWANFTIERADGKPTGIDRVTASPDEITAVLEPSKQDPDVARVNVTVRRPSDSPSVINGTVQMWSRSQPDRPVQTISVTARILGELAVAPSKLYWVIPDFGKDKASYPSGTLMKKIELTSVLGREVELKNAASTIQGMSVQIVPKQPGKTFELVLKFDDVPKAFGNGKVTVETSLASLPKVEVPLTVAVPESR
jgi:hypothetical protein